MNINLYNHELHELYEFIIYGINGIIIGDGTKTHVIHIHSGGGSTDGHAAGRAHARYAPTACGMPTKIIKGFRIKIFLSKKNMFSLYSIHNGPMRSAHGSIP